MFSPRGVLMCAKPSMNFAPLSARPMRNRLAGLDCRMISPAEVKRLSPSSMMIRIAAMPHLRRLLPAAWRHGAA
jgi:hypothetical protein